MHKSRAKVAAPYTMYVRKIELHPLLSAFVPTGGDMTTGHHLDLLPQKPLLVLRAATLIIAHTHSDNIQIHQSWGKKTKFQDQRVIITVWIEIQGRTKYAQLYAQFGYRLSGLDFFDWMRTALSVVTQSISGKLRKKRRYMI